MRDILNGTSPYTGLVMAGLFVLGIILLIAILFCQTMQNTLRAIDVENQRMRPGQVWLIMIPIFNFVWAFICVQKISESIEAQYRSRDMYVEPKPTYNVGLAWAILRCTTIIPVIGYLSAFAEIICFLVYWVKLAEFKKSILQLPPPDFSNNSVFNGNSW